MTVPSSQRSAACIHAFTAACACVWRQRHTLSAHSMYAMNAALGRLQARCTGGCLCMRAHTTDAESKCRMHRERRLYPGMHLVSYGLCNAPLSHWPDWHGMQALRCKWSAAACDIAVHNVCWANHRQPTQSPADRFCAYSTAPTRPAAGASVLCHLKVFSCCAVRQGRQFEAGSGSICYAGPMRGFGEWDAERVCNLQQPANCFTEQRWVAVAGNVCNRCSATYFTRHNEKAFPCCCAGLERKLGKGVTWSLKQQATLMAENNFQMCEHISAAYSR